LEFSRTRAHYLVFKEQVLLIRIISTFSPLSSALYLRQRVCSASVCAPPRAAPVYVTNPRFPVKHLFEKSCQLPVASFRFPVLVFGFFGGTGVSPVHVWCHRLSSLCTLPLRPTRRPPLTKTFPVCRTPSGLAARLQVSDPNQWPGIPAPGPDA
jgi:hypothetical protein